MSVVLIAGMAIAAVVVASRALRTHGASKIVRESHEEERSAGLPLSFNRDIRPILSDKCFFCHGPDAGKRKGDLRLDIREHAVAAGAFVPGDAETSELVKRIYATDPEDIMPRPESHKVLSDEQKALLTRWIQEGAEYTAHWAYTPVMRPDFPGIDAIVADRLKRERLAPSGDADRHTLIRRVSLDLIGLPPEPEEVATFVRDDSPGAYEALVDRLLGSVHYGEKMAIYWLDAVRFADTVGYHGDQPRDASPYRDYVIESFNSNKTFDVFTIEQIAGDLLPEATFKQRIAAGYNRLNQLSAEGGIQDKEYIKKYQAERVRTLSTTWLGSTLACAECHDHKFDPFTSKDFYSMAAFFADILEKGAWNPDGHYQEDTGPYLAPEDTIMGGSPEEPLLKVRNDVFEFPANPLPAISQPEAFRTSPATIGAKPRIVRVLPRGNWMDESGEVVQPATPHFLPGEWAGTTSSPRTVTSDANTVVGIAGTNVIGRATRLELARWLIDRDNPLTSRAYVNRLWAQFFGTPLSKVAEDLGQQGEYPVYPELLDWLAAEFMESGWDVKHLVKLIVMSGTYRQSSSASPSLLERDPYNRLLARQTPRRLSAELIRDNALKISGLLNPFVGGPSVRPYQPEGYYEHLNFPKRGYTASADQDQYRRGVYTHWQRTFLHPMLLTFDAPARDECSVSRPKSNTPLQALNLLNDPSFVEAAQALAKRVHASATGDVDRIALAFAHALARPPLAGETETLQALLAKERLRYEKDEASAKQSVGPAMQENASFVELAALTSVSRAILNLHETITRY
ncbi:MAG: PSD1 and planctomycete cytochrome C domain-containing protein [Verrucomicrobia bacterium]|nr:PSD1 and planctomycete cytochrome C domain-containing protein [Verrucomicrobiota bacterium]